MRRSARLVPLLAIAALAFSIPSTTLGSHLRPKGATPMRIPFIPASKACTAPTGAHSPPLAFPNCNPQVHASSYLVVGTPDSPLSAPAGANSIGFAIFQAIPGNGTIIVQTTDVRCRNASGGGPILPAANCPLANNVAGTPTPNDYLGELELRFLLTLTDHTSAPPATTVAFPFTVSVPCNTTVSVAVGSTCTINTTFNAVIPGTIVAANRNSWEYGQVQLYDGGADATGSTQADNTLFEVQGMFYP